MGAIDELVAELARLPGIGPKTARRLAFHLLQQPREQPARLAAALSEVAARVHACPDCGNYTEAARCVVCDDAERDPGILCVVEEASTVAAVERTGFKGRYVVLGGRLSPLSGVGPDRLRLDLLARRVRGGDGQVREVILATNPSLEGEATATYIQQLLDGTGVRVTRLARGLPVGGDLEYIDGVTLSHALAARQEVS
ncbi:MAG TPA: recombination mediator RecR [Gemmatimonadales bacterium]|nr:recombination mediator RecR [Gemmatimonadales bacterium]